MHMWFRHLEGSSAHESAKNPKTPQLLFELIKNGKRSDGLFGSPTPVLNLFGTNLVQDLTRNIWYRFGTEYVEQCSKILDSPPQFSSDLFGNAHVRAQS